MSDLIRPLVGRRVLVVEDEYLIAMQVKEWLEAAGADVVGPVPSVEQALDLIEDDDVDAAILDINLGGKTTVYPVADRLAALGVPYLFATADVKVSDADAYRYRPRTEKPFLKAGLMSAVTKLASTP
ncbi:DNA-binding response OmpR family regulator [Methylorubrum thiocyanatum]